MEKCFRCGNSSENTVLYDAISKEGLVKICGHCNVRENLPVLKKAGSVPEEKRQTVYERMTRLSGFNPKERELHERQAEMSKQNEEMRQIIDRNFRKEMTDLKKEAGGDDLVRNWHWELMKARRAKHITQRELADAIGESELAVRMAERGMLPRERERLVRKLESYLKIRILTRAPAAAVETPASAEEVPIEEIKKKFSIRELFGFKRKEKKEEKTEEKAAEPTEVQPQEKK